MWLQRFFSHRSRMMLSLFIISTIHMVAFGMAQYPSGFFITNISHKMHLSLMALLDVSVIIMALYNQKLTRKFGVKKVLLGGLGFYFLGLVLFFISQFSSGSIVFASFFLILGMIVCGIAFSTAFIALVTYLVLGSPKSLEMSITALFAFVNIGAMLSPLVMHYLTSWDAQTFFLIFVESLILFSIIFIYEYFVDPSFPAHLQKFRRPTLIWRELHYRFFLFVVMIMLYSICESTLNVWGAKFLGFFLHPGTVSWMVAIFWLFLIIGQFLMLIPLYFFATRGVFFFLLFLLVLVLISLPVQTEWVGFVSRLALGGVACSAVSPILISMLEEELREVQHTSYFHLRILPYFEMGIAWIIMGYFASNGMIALASEMIILPTKEVVQQQFVYAMIAAILMLPITIFLSISLHRKRKKRKILNLDEI